MKLNCLFLNYKGNRNWNKTIFPIRFYKYFILFLFLAIGVNFIRALIVSYFGWHFEKNSFTGMIGFFISRSGQILSSFIFVPIIEEVAFRLFLIPSKKNIAISIVVISILYTDCFLTTLGAVGSKYIVVIVIVVLMAVIFISIVHKHIISFAKLHFKIYVGISIVLFVYFHLFIYKFSWYLILISPIFFLPHIVIGIILSYLRIKYGLMGSILFHAIYNGILILMLSYF